MEDLTQIPPFHPTVLVENGVVTAFTGMANQHWIDTHPGHVAYEPADADNLPHLGYGYSGGVFEQPPTPSLLPAQEATDV